MSLQKPSREHRRDICLSLVIFACLVVAACGVKAPPVPPDYAPPAAVTDLGYTLEEQGSVVLSWSISGREREKGANVQGARVYRSKDALDSPACEDCPRIYNIAADLPLEQDKMVYREPLQKGFRYYYKIVIYDEGNHDSEDSNVVNFEYR